MSSVDQGNQLKAGYTFQEIHRKGGHHSLITWLLETALVNAYLLSYYSAVSEKNKFTDHRAFREAVITQCFEMGKNSRKHKKRSPTYTLEAPSTIIPVTAHHLVSRGRKKRGDCVVCKRGVKRRALSETDGNRRGCEYRKSTTYGCEECNIPICKEGS